MQPNIVAGEKWHKDEAQENCLGWLKFVNGKMASKYSEFLVQNAWICFKCWRSSGKFIVLSKKTVSTCSLNFNCSISTFICIFFGVMSRQNALDANWELFGGMFLREIEFKEFVESNFLWNFYWLFKMKGKWNS